MGPVPGRPEVILPGWCQHPSPRFGERQGGCLPFPESHREETELLYLFVVFQCQQQRSKISPADCLIAIRKIMLFQGKRESSPPLRFPATRPCLLIRSHSNPNKHIYHHKNCRLSEHTLHGPVFHLKCSHAQVSLVQAGWACREVLQGHPGKDQLVSPVPPGPGTVGRSPGRSQKP